MKLKYYTDGGCHPNPGPGAWAFVLVSPYTEVSGVLERTTSNQAELTAIIRAIEHGLEQKSSDIIIHTDSQYCANGFNEWMENWNSNGWKRKNGDGELEDVKNKELWRKMYEYRQSVRIYWVRGHNGNEYNEVADGLVRRAFESSFESKMKY